MILHLHLHTSLRISGMSIYVSLCEFLSRIPTDPNVRYPQVRFDIISVQFHRHRQGEDPTRAPFPDIVCKA